MTLLRSRGAAATPLIVAVLLLASCSNSADEGSDSPEPRVLERDGVTTFVLGDVDGAGEALIEGPLSLTENGCLAITVANGQTYVLAWPPGVELLTDDAGVHVPDVGDFVVGDEISAGGGYRAPPFDDALKMPEVPDRCLTTASNEIAMIQQKSSINR